MKSLFSLCLRLWSPTGSLEEGKGPFSVFVYIKGPLLHLSQKTEGKGDEKGKKRQKAGSQTPTRTSVRSSSAAENKEGGGRGWKREGEGGRKNNGPFTAGQMKG